MTTRIGAASVPGTARSVVGWTQVWMDTLVTIQLAVPAHDAAAWRAPVGRAFSWFAAVETACSRFTPDSEVARLAHRVGEPVAVSPILLAALRFSLALAQATDGVFDPASGARLEAAGFDRCYRTGRRVRLAAAIDPSATWRDADLDAEAGTVRLARPVLFDLGAVAKGHAVDLAARELTAAPGAVINAGGDVYLHGLDPHGRPWRVGLAHPDHPRTLLGEIRLRDRAIASSGRAARVSADGQPHLRPPGGGRPELTGAAVVAPTAMLADGLATAVVLLGRTDGLDIVSATPATCGLLVTADGHTLASSGFPQLAGVPR
jgi:thiamine biosynthesis lipoprotein